MISSKKKGIRRKEEYRKKKQENVEKKGNRNFAVRTFAVGF
jgi:hypothetical protein